MLLFCAENYSKKYQVGSVHQFSSLLSWAKKYHDEIVYQINMSIYGELDPMIEHRTQFAFKGKREHIATVNTPNIAYPGQHFKIIIPHGSADHLIVPDTVKITFDLEIDSTDKACSVVNDVGRTLVKKVLRLGSKESITLVFMTHTRTFT